MRPSDSKVVITSEAIVRLALSNREDEDRGRRDAFTFNYWESPLAVGVSFRHLHDSHSPVTDNLLLPGLCARLQPFATSITAFPAVLEFKSLQYHSTQQKLLRTRMRLFDQDR